MPGLTLTLRTLLAYIDDTLDPHQARELGQKVAESDEARILIERIKKVTRRRGLTAPSTHGDDGDVSDPNIVAAYLSDNLGGRQLRELEETCLDSDVHLAEVAACHQILTLVLTEPVRVPPSANQRMYKLVESPASDPNRKPGKTHAVGGVGPRNPDQPDADDPDAALLLGLKRYSRGSWAGQGVLLGAVLTIAACLVLAVRMALPHASPDAPEVSPHNSYALATPPSAPAPSGNGGGSVAPAPAPGSGGPTTPDPKKDMTEPKKDTGETVAKKPEDPKKDMTEPKTDPGPKLGDPVKPPLGGDEILGDMRTENVIVLTRAPDAGAGWLRLDPTKPVIHASETVMALPGYKADVKLNTGVTVHLWGNVPEQVSMQAMVMQSRVRFHPPADGFAADITLESGRIYLKSLKLAGAKVRLRIAGLVWDIALKNNQTDVLAQVNTAFVPGTMFAREGGEKPKTEVYIAVVAGAAEYTLPARWKGTGKESPIPLDAGQEVTWTSTKNVVSDKQPIAGLYPDRTPPLEAEFGKALQRVLSEAARDLTKPDGIGILLKERLTAQPPAALYKGDSSQLQLFSLMFPTIFAAYSMTAIMEGPDAPDMLKDMIDALGDRIRMYARRAAVIALSSWIAQAPGNTDMIIKAMIAKGWRDDDATLIARLLRGYSSAAIGDTAAVDDLVGWLDHDHVAVREAALGNLIAFFDPEAWGKKELTIDVAVRKEPLAEKAYDNFLKAWKARGEEIKQKMMAAAKKP